MMKGVMGQQYSYSALIGVLDHNASHGHQLSTACTCLKMYQSNIYVVGKYMYTNIFVHGHVLELLYVSL